MANPLLLPEIIDSVLDHVNTVPDLLNCACINHVWNVRALMRLYKGSPNDLRYRTPHVGWLNCLFVASRERFVQNTSFVKHLLLHPEKPLTRSAHSGFEHLACGESCRPLRQRRYAEALLRPEGAGSGGAGGGLASLTIPFMIVNQDWRYIDDLLVSPVPEFLAINELYCIRVMQGCTNTLGPSMNSELLREKFSRLKALTIYHCGGGRMTIRYLWEMINCCDLQFFHFEDWKRNPLSSREISQLLTSLKTQRNLKALALRTPPCRRESVPGTIAPAEEWEEAWPDLKAIYLTQVDQLRLNQVIKFKNLEILSLNDGKADHTQDNPYNIEGIATCRNLRVLDIWFRDVDDQKEMLLKIAQACPLLRRLSVRCSEQSKFFSKLDDSTFHSLIRALPHLQYLDLDYNIRMDGAWVQELAANCPNLTVLRLSRAGLYISLNQLKNTQPFCRLEIMDTKRIFLQDPQSLTKLHEFSILASEWRRIFPKIRAMPCSDDIVGASVEKRYQENLRSGISNEQLSGSDWDDDPESEGENDPSPWNDDAKRRSDWFLLRLRLWEELQYGKDDATYDQIADLWQTDFEIENVGWPVVPLKSFGNDDTI